MAFFRKIYHWCWAARSWWQKILIALPFALYLLWVGLNFLADPPLGFVRHYQKFFDLPGETFTVGKVAVQRGDEWVLQVTPPSTIEEMEKLPAIMMKTNFLWYVWSRDAIVPGSFHFAAYDSEKQRTEFILFDSTSGASQSKTLKTISESSERDPVGTAIEKVEVICEDKKPLINYYKWNKDISELRQIQEIVDALQSPANNPYDVVFTFRGEDALLLRFVEEVNEVDMIAFSVPSKDFSVITTPRFLFDEIKISF